MSYTMITTPVMKGKFHLMEFVGYTDKLNTNKKIFEDYFNDEEECYNTLFYTLMDAVTVVINPRFTKLAEEALNIILSFSGDPLVKLGKSPSITLSRENKHLSGVIMILQENDPGIGQLVEYCGHIKFCNIFGHYDPKYILDSQKDVVMVLHKMDCSG